ncbi:MAG: hypothetical protein ACJ8GN_05160 [Longimicrobiaceae bacterium]
MTVPIPGELPSARFRELRGERIVETVERLAHRIDERFPGSGLSGVCHHLHAVAAAAADDVPRLGRPIWPLRLFIVAAIAVLVAVAGWMASLLLRVSLDPGNISEVLQGSDAARNDIIFLAVAIFFLVSLETRVKRRRVLRSLHRLRSIVHIVDMHQLTKDPAPRDMPRVDTASSPERVLSPYELSRYLDYCSEMLSLAAKLAALHVQYVNDPVVLDAVNDIEVLAANLSSKIWQKIMILDSSLPQAT